MLDSDAFDFVDRCSRFSNTADLLDDLRHLVAGLGFDYLIFTGVPIGNQSLAPLVELNGWPVEWFDRYVENDHAAKDSVCIHAARTVHPFAWDEVPDQLASMSASRRVHGEAAEIGIRSGYVVTMASYSHWSAAISFASSLERVSLSTRERARLNLVATYAGATAETLVGYASLPDPLTAREKEVLTWTAAGKSAWEISVILSISRRTVLTHCEHIRQKFGVPTMIQAVVQALRRRIIAP